MRFFLIDKIIEWVPGSNAAAIKNIALSEDFFDDHFPLRPIMPGALLLEGMAQLSGILIEETVLQDSGRTVKAMLSIVERAKFRRQVKPGDQIRYSAKVISINDMGGRASVTAEVSGQPVAECDNIFSFSEYSSSHLEQRRKEILAVWLKGVSSDE